MPFLIILIGILIQIALTVKKVSPFLSLLIVAIFIGLLLGMQPTRLISCIEKGVGNTLGGLVLILCLGAILGKLLETSGAAEQITVTLIGAFGEKYIQWAVLLTAFLVGIPLFYNAGFIILVPLIFSISKRTGLPLLYLAIPMAAALSVTHCFLPPHPGPVVLANAFKANIGKTLLLGLAIAVPAVIIAGPLFGKMIKRTGGLQPVNDSQTIPATAQELPGRMASFVIALLPVLLITLAVLTTQLMSKEYFFTRVIAFAGDPTIALLIAVVCAIYFLGIRPGRSMPQVMLWANNAVAGIAMILLIITAGGVLKQVLIDSGTGAYITTFSSRWQIHPLVFGWLVTALLRVTIGSATVAGITAAGVVAPLLSFGNTSPELMVLAVGSGSVFGSHVNDSGFWMFKEFFHLTLKQTFLSWTVMETIISLLGLAGVLLLDVFI